MRLLSLFLLVAIALAQEPVDVAGWMELGAGESSYGNYRRTAVAFERAVAADPSSGPAQFLLGEAYGQQFRPNVDEPENLRSLVIGGITGGKQIWTSSSLHSGTAFPARTGRRRSVCGLCLSEISK